VVFLQFSFFSPLFHEKTDANGVSSVHSSVWTLAIAVRVCKRVARAEKFWTWPSSGTVKRSRSPGYKNPTNAGGKNGQLRSRSLIVPRIDFFTKKLPSFIGSPPKSNSRNTVQPTTGLLLQYIYIYIRCRATNKGCSRRLPAAVSLLQETVRASSSRWTDETKTYSYIILSQGFSHPSSSGTKIVRWEWTT
jgi:hypothetical protein